ncbi:O-antigen ligase family protein [Salinibacter sp.]|uniref:O-antigen ligase family protein n=1 Tax=Salinibacter sp. TaxID=2065818 RepID=UPI0021E84A2C|nr:O-antigen ligase family protein [Salinibacter sp.]
MDHAILPQNPTSFKNVDQQTFFGSRAVFCGVLGYIVFVPTLSVLPEAGTYNEKRVLQIGIFVIFGVVLLISRSTRKALLSTVARLPRMAKWGLGMGLMGGILSALRAPAPSYAFLEVGHFGLLFVTAGVVTAAVRESPRQTERHLLGAVALSAALYALFFGVGYGMHLTIEEIKLWPEGGTNYVNIRFFNQYQTWTLPLLGGLLVAIPKRWKNARVGVLGLIALWWALVFTSSVRGTIVAMAVAAIGVALLFRRHAKPWLLAQAAGLFGGLLLYHLLFSTEGGLKVVERFSEGRQYSGRLQLWLTSLEMAWAHPWLGAGPMHFAWPPFHFSTGAHPHNAFLQWLAEWGLPSTGIMSGLAVWGGWRWMDQERRAAEEASAASNGVRVALVGSVLAAAAHAMVSGLLVTPISQVFLALVGGWAWGRYQFKQESTPVPSNLAHAVLCVLLVGAMGVVGSSLKDLSTVEERRDALLEAVDRNRFSPRYWGQGFLHVRDSEVIDRARRDR